MFSFRKKGKGAAEAPASDALPDDGRRAASDATAGAPPSASPSKERSEFVEDMGGLRDIVVESFRKGREESREIRAEQQRREIYGTSFDAAPEKFRRDPFARGVRIAVYSFIAVLLILVLSVASCAAGSADAAQVQYGKERMASVSGMTVEEMQDYIASNPEPWVVVYDEGGEPVRILLPTDEGELDDMARSIDEDDSDLEVMKKMTEDAVALNRDLASVLAELGTGKDYSDLI